MRIYKQKSSKYPQQLNSAKWEFSALWGLWADSQAQGASSTLKDTKILGPKLKFCHYNIDEVEFLFFLNVPLYLFRAAGKSIIEKLILSFL